MVYWVLAKWMKRTHCKNFRASGITKRSPKLTGKKSHIQKTKNRKSIRLLKSNSGSQERTGKCLIKLKENNVWPWILHVGNTQQCLKTSLSVTPEEGVLPASSALPSSEWKRTGETLPTYTKWIWGQHN